MEFSRSFRLSRSHHILLSSESVSSECAKIAGYERLSQSLRLSGEYDFIDKQKKHKRGVGLLGKVFSFRRVSSPHGVGEPNKVAETVVKKDKKRSSWLPDPDRRWPIQGWSWKNRLFPLDLTPVGVMGFSGLCVSRLKLQN
ncbi:hypothetical protein D0Y65_001851 [Glycine soja]|nr:hypothetical protein D0Y65_001851 [Glycine soja]